MNEVVTTDRSGAERGEVRGFHLAVNYAEIVSLQEFAQVGERNFRGVTGMGKHRFAKKGTPDRHAIQAADEFSVLPGLDAVRMPLAMQRSIGGDHAVADPGAILALARGLCAGLHHRREGRVETYFVLAVAQGFGQRAGNFQFTGQQHHAGVGAPPQNRVARGIPGKDAAPIGGKQPLR